ncbi:MAG: helix-turn-helix transcriptional regulator [Candidatus Yonathbacteria bacterium]|nr:helix-turn-helix transcriptional regulator [Candidatus Yonathbacteria bacterium]
MKQQELAAAVKITTNYLCSLEQRRTAPSIDCLSRIAKKLGQPFPRLLEKHPLFTGLEELVAAHGQKEVSIAFEIILKNMERGKTNTT